LWEGFLSEKNKKNTKNNIILYTLSIIIYLFNLNLEIRIKDDFMIYAKDIIKILLPAFILIGFFMSGLIKKNIKTLSSILNLKNTSVQDS
jgi:hypothetical protein